MVDKFSNNSAIIDETPKVESEKSTHIDDDFENDNCKGTGQLAR